MKTTFLFCGMLLIPFVYPTSLSAMELVNVTIDFTDQLGGIPPIVNDGVFNPYAIFSTSPGAQLLMFAGAGTTGTSGPNSITAGLDPLADTFNSDFYIDFVYPVNDFSFVVASDNDAGHIATLRVYTSTSGTVPAQTLQVVGNGDLTDPIPIDLTGQSEITRIEVVEITDEFGLSYDDLSFSTLPVPEPSTAVLMLAGAFCFLRGWRVTMPRRRTFC